MNCCDSVIDITTGRNILAFHRLECLASPKNRAMNTYQKVVEKSLISDTIFLALPPIYDVKMARDLKP